MIYYFYAISNNLINCFSFGLWNSEVLLPLHSSFSESDCVIAVLVILEKQNSLCLTYSLSVCRVGTVMSLWFSSDFACRSLFVQWRECISRTRQLGDFTMSRSCERRHQPHQALSVENLNWIYLLHERRKELYNVVSAWTWTSLHTVFTHRSCHQVPEMISFKTDVTKHTI